MSDRNSRAMNDLVRVLSDRIFKCNGSSFECPYLSGKLPPGNLYAKGVPISPKSRASCLALEIVSSPTLAQKLPVAVSLHLKQRLITDLSLRPPFRQLLPPRKTLLQLWTSKTMIYFQNPCSNDARDHSARSDSGLPLSSHFSRNPKPSSFKPSLPSYTLPPFASSLHCNFVKGG
ncbi:hypothetical protein CDAR_45091 [Caerostris darwini]|uniref:Uncharacterized protein n=1 Tax=Caerostris darwini TaxID=1538125 RepID=A0AAV4UZB8_9ARAC|nr:hypothetical protein CDAR_45091 [Caerostris darwini]